jgi:glycosyltransferase involved in cell wall biosynthesis
MPLTLAVIIPCYKPHLPKLQRLLESLSVQTRLPYEVIVACSSVEPCDVSGTVPANLPIRWILTSGRANAAMNRNAGSRLSNCDVLSYIDADDIAHPRRCEAVLSAMEGGADIVLHNYCRYSATSGIRWDMSIEGPMYGCLQRAPSGCVIHRDDWRIPLHHSQATMHRSVFLLEQYPEGAEFERHEDAVFCGRVVARSEIRNAYIATPLSLYDEAGEWIPNFR